MKFWRFLKPLSLLTPNANLGVLKTTVRFNHLLQVLVELRKAIILMVMVDYNKIS